MIRKTGLVILSIFIFLSITIPMRALAADESAINVKWGYKGDIGPEKWGELSTNFKLCASGKTQAPINIPDKTRINLNKLRINYMAAPLQIGDELQTPLTIGNKQIIVLEDSIQVNFNGGVDENLVFNDKKFKLLQFHIHTPSETNWHSEVFPLEIHFVHQGENGEVAVLAVLAKTGQENQEIKTIVSHLPTDKGKAHDIVATSIDPSKLLPSKLDYYSFEGSLTTPPCAEGVRWFVMANPIMVSPAQVVQIKKAIGGPNARPTQPLNGRQVFYTD